MNDYHFVTTWRVEGLCGEVADILSDPVGLARWWPSVYLQADELEGPDASGVGRRVRVRTKGWLPYTLRWEFTVVDVRYPNGFTIEATGDFDGRGVWTLTQKGSEVEVVYDWRLRVEKALLRDLSFLLKPAFEANHRWAMAQGETSLKLELARRRATSDAAREAIGPPPGPVTYAGVLLLAGAVAVAAGVTYAAIKMTKAARSRDGDSADGDD